MQNLSGTKSKLACAKKERGNLTFSFWVENRARMAIGDLYSRHRMWKEAWTSYESIVTCNVLLKKPGWNARLAIARLLLLEDVQDGTKWGPEVYSWLSTMIRQPVGDNVLLEPLELLGK